MSAYKKLLPQDYSIIPFNAHKQYTFNSASAASNKIEYFTASYNSTSIDLFNSGNVRYSQIDHLFYKDYKTSIDNKFGNINYLKQQRNLYDQVNILSIPIGLQGHKIKPGSFILSSSGKKIIDDSYGNILIDGTEPNDYCIDFRSVLLNIGPVKGFQKYDLDVIDDFILSNYRPNSSFYQKGQRRIDSFYAPQLFKNGTFTDIADSGSAIDNTQFGPLHDYPSGQHNSASIENETLVIKSNPRTDATLSNMGARFDHSATEGTSYQFSVFAGEGDTGSIHIQHVDGTGLGSAHTIPNQSTAINYTALDNTDVRIFFRANKNSIDGGTSSFDNISVIERGISGYTTPSMSLEYDDSYFLNPINYKKIEFSSSSLFSSDGVFPVIDFNGYNSGIQVNHHSKYNFNPSSNFTIEFWCNIKNNDLDNEIYLISKSTTKTIIPSPLEGSSGTYSLHTTGSSQPQNVSSEPQYPFEIYVKKFNNKSYLFFRQYDGNNTSETFTEIEKNSFTHVTCRVSSSIASIFLNGKFKSSIGNSILKNTSNNANIYIGNKGNDPDIYSSSYLSGSLSQLKIYDKALTNTNIENHYSSSNGSPYIGNIFYSNGLATITHPDYALILTKKRIGIGEAIINSNTYNSRFVVGGAEQLPFGIELLKFQGSHLIYEYEYQCTIDEHEFNSTQNPTTRQNSEKPKDFATSSFFKPYITTVGLYNDQRELLAIGKLGQPFKTSNETDTTIIVRWDT